MCSFVVIHLYYVVNSCLVICMPSSQLVWFFFLYLLLNAPLYLLLNTHSHTFTRYRILRRRLLTVCNTRQQQPFKWNWKTGLNKYSVLNGLRHILCVWTNHSNLQLCCTSMQTHKTLSNMLGQTVWRFSTVLNKQNTNSNTEQI